jgi:hypothetical protein
MKTLEIKSRTIGIFLITLAIQIMVQTAKADQNLPNFAGQSALGRMPVFVSPKSLSWFLPVSFSTTLICPPASLSADSKRSCVVRIMNSYGPEENNSITSFSNGGSELIALNTFQAGLVQSVKESFTGSPQEVDTKEMKLETLVVQEKAPYAALHVRADAESIDKFARMFQTTGVGIFTSEVVFNAEAIGDYISILNPDDLKSALLDLNGKYSRRDLNTRLDGIVSALQISFYNMQEAEARSIIREQIKKRYFSISWWGSYYLVNENLSDLPKPLVVLDEQSKSPFPVSCVTTIELRQDAKPKTNCQAVTL